MKNKSISIGVIISSIFIVLLVVGVICAAFYFYNGKTAKVESVTLSGGNIALTYSDDENLFSIENAIPTSDFVGISADSVELYFDFTVKTIVEEANFIEYEVLLVKDENVSSSKNENIKVYLEKEKNGSYVNVIDPTVFDVNVVYKELGSNVMSIYKHKKSSSGSDNYRLRMWVSDTATFDLGEIQNFGVKVAIKGIAE